MAFGIRSVDKNSVQRFALTLEVEPTRERAAAALPLEFEAGVDSVGFIDTDYFGKNQHTFKQYELEHLNFLSKSNNQR